MDFSVTTIVIFYNKKTLTRHVEGTAVAISERQVCHTFQFTISFRVNFEEFQVTFTSKITLSPCNKNKRKITVQYI
jgi:hypothetical protein